MREGEERIKDTRVVGEWRVKKRERKERRRREEIRKRSRAPGKVKRKKSSASQPIQEQH